MQVSLEGSVIRLVLTDWHVAAGKHKRNPTSVFLHHDFNCITASPKLLPRLLDYFRRQDVIAEKTLAILCDQHEDIDRAIFGMKRPTAILFGSRLDADLPSATRDEDPLAVFAQRVG